MFRFTALLLMAATLLSLTLSAVRCHCACGESRAHVHMPIANDLEPVHCRCRVHSTAEATVASLSRPTELVQHVTKEPLTLIVLLPAIEESLSVRASDRPQHCNWKLLPTSNISHLADRPSIGRDNLTCIPEGSFINPSELAMFFRNSVLLI